MDALAPVVASGMRRQAQDPAALQDLLSAVLAGGYDRTFIGEEAATLDGLKPRGDQILGQIFGNDKEMSREVAQRLSASTGIGSAILKKLLPVLATVVAGWLAKQVGSGRAAGRDSGLRPGSSNSGGRTSGGGLGGMVPDISIGGSGTTPPQPRSAQPPMPGPSGTGSNGSLEDILGEILKGGTQNGRVIVKQIPPDQMGDILRDIFGGNPPGGGSASLPRHQPSDEAYNRGRKTIDDVLGGGTTRGNAADDLLNSVENSLRRGR
jgi:hypothetical protein